MCLRVQLVNGSALLEFWDEAHVDESLRVSGLGARIACGGEVEDDLDGGGLGVRNPGETALRRKTHRRPPARCAGEHSDKRVPFQSFHGASGIH